MTYKQPLFGSLITGACIAAIGATAAAADQMPPERSLSGLEYDLIGREILGGIFFGQKGRLSVALTGILGVKRRACNHNL